MQLRQSDSPSIQFIQSLLLTQVCLIFSGSMKLVLRMQIETSLLVHFCSRLRKDSLAVNYSDAETEDTWKAWIATEARKRLLHCIFRQYLQVSKLKYVHID